MARQSLIPQLIVASLAVAVTALLAIQLLSLVPLLPQLALIGGAGATIAAALAIGLRRPRLVTVAGGGLLLVYALTLVGRPDSSIAATSAPVIAGGIFLSTQLGWWATELRSTARESMVDLARRGAQLGAGAVATGVFAEVIWQASRIHAGRGLQFLVFGLLAAIGIGALVLGVAALRPSTRGQVSRDLLTLQPSSRYLPSPLRGPSIAVSIRKAVGRVVAPADALSSRGARPRVALRTMIAAILLLVDTTFTATEAHYSAKNAAPAIAFGFVVAGAIVLAWLGLTLAALARPVTNLQERPSTYAPPPPADLGGLEVIRPMTQRAWRSGGCDAEFARYLTSLGHRLEGSSPSSDAEQRSSPKSLADVTSLIADLERVADA